MTYTRATFIIITIALSATLGFALHWAVNVQAADSSTLEVCSACTYTTIQDAVHAADDGDTIQVAQGAYTGTMVRMASGTPFTFTVLITKNLTLLGGYSQDFGERDPALYETVIDGEGQLGSVVGILGAKATVDGF